MSSYKDTFETDAFAPRVFAVGVFRGFGPPPTSVGRATAARSGDIGRSASQRVGIVGECTAARTGIVGTAEYGRP